VTAARQDAISESPDRWRRRVAQLCRQFKGRFTDVCAQLSSKMMTSAAAQQITLRAAAEQEISVLEPLETVTGWMVFAFPWKTTPGEPDYGGRIHYRKLRGGYRDDRTEAAGSRSDGDTPTRLSLAPPITPNSPPGELRYPRPPVPSIGATIGATVSPLVNATVVETGMGPFGRVTLPPTGSCSTANQRRRKARVQPQQTKNRRLTDS
jgi:hypothetical protein